MSDIDILHQMIRVCQKITFTFNHSDFGAIV